MLGFSKHAEALKEKMDEIEALSDYYDEIFNGTTRENLAIGKEKMKYIRAQILKNTFEAKNMIKAMQIEEAPDHARRNGRPARSAGNTDRGRK